MAAHQFYREECVLKYRGFEIACCPDSGIKRHNDQMSVEEVCAGYYCQVYSANDDQYAYELDAFCLAEGYEIADGSAESLWHGIVKYIDDTYERLQDKKAAAAGKRNSALLGRAVCWIGENESGRELYDVLSDGIGMTDDEIREIGFTSLVSYFDRKSYAQTIAEYLIETGTESTSSGNWIISFEEINQRYAVNLPSDKVLMENISRYLYDCSDSVADFCITDEGVDLDFYYGQCPNYCGGVQEGETDADIQPQM